jgi:hypothetical protein
MAIEIINVSGALVISAISTVIGIGIAYIFYTKTSNKLVKKWHQTLHMIGAISISLGVMAIANEYLCYEYLGLEFRGEFVVGKLLTNFILFPLIIYLPILASMKFSGNNFETRSESDGVQDEIWLSALNEFESTQRDRALYAKLLAEYDGNENIIKAKYIKIKVKEKSKKEANQKIHKPIKNTWGEYDSDVQEVKNPYDKLEKTLFQKLLEKWGAPKWTESVIIIAVAGTFYLIILNYSSFMRLVLT